MKYKMIPKLAEPPVVGVTLELSENDATHLSYALNKIDNQEWPWLKQFRLNLNRARAGKKIIELRDCEKESDVK